MIPSLSPLIALEREHDIQRATAARHDATRRGRPALRLLRLRRTAGRRRGVVAVCC